MITRCMSRVTGSAMEAHPPACLPELLDITTASDISARFTDIADELLKRSHLVFGEVAFEFLEIEFYLNSGRHKDPFTHGNEEQGVTGRWYFHRASTSGTAGFRGGTRKGFDLTFGPATKSRYFSATDASNPDEGARGAF
ncbi:hypothetical protein BD779DRAFT_541824 [Infundibulicybe gibba]|nr:hypothetical protein BD779DRAFT_541824 [Infundibulicybe gibba]